MRQLGRRGAVLTVVGAALLAVAAVGITVVVRDSGTHRQVADVPTSIANDCSTDVTAAINGYLAHEPDGTTVRFPADACYRVDGTLRLQDRHHLTIDGNGARFQSTRPRNAASWQITGGSDITLRDLTITGTNHRAAYDSAYEFGHAVEISGADGVTLDHITGRDTAGDFVDIGPDIRGQHGPDGAGAVMARQITVENSDSDVTGRNAISCTGCDGITITHDHFADDDYLGIDLELEAKDWYDRNIAVTDNTFGIVHLAVLNGSGAGHDLSHLRFSDNVMARADQTCDPAVVIGRTTPTTDVTITDNTLIALGRAISVDGASDVTITGNRAVVRAGCSSTRGLFLSDLHTATVRGNDFAGSAQGFALLAAGTTNAGATIPGTTICGNRVPGDPAFDRPRTC